MSTNETNLAAMQQQGTGTGTMGTESRVVAGGKMKALLQQSTGEGRKCSNPIWIGVFWLHFFGMCALIAISLTANDEASDGILSFFTDFLLGDGSGRKILGAMLGCAICGGIWSFVWVRFLRCFENNSIKICLYLYHFLVAVMIGVAFWQDIKYVLYFYAVQLVLYDLILYFQRDTFPFSEALLRVGLGAITNNNKAQCFAYLFMPIQILLYIFWILGMMFTLAMAPDMWYMWIVLFMASYNWVGYFFHFIVHTFTTVLAGFWLMGLKDGYSKASQSCKMAFTTSQGPIALASLIMAILALIRTCLSLTIKISTCLVCYQCVWKACCGWIEAIIARFNEYVLAYVALLNCEFGEGSRRLVELFSVSGMQIVVNEVGWAVCLDVGVLLGFCVSGGVGLLLHTILWGDEFNVTSESTLAFCFYCIYGWLGATSASVGLVPLRSCLSTVFVVWADEPASFAAGQPTYYNDLMASVEACPKVKTALEPLLRNAPKGAEKTV